jgi:AraC-like DNA-binding protein
MVNMPDVIDLIPDNGLNTGLIQTGHGTAIPDGLVHRKTAPCIIIAQVLQGRYEVECRGKTIIAREEEAFLAATNDWLTITHHGDPRKGGVMKARWLHVHFTLFETIDFSSLLDIPPKCDRRFGRRFGEIIAELLTGNASENVNPLWTLARKKELVFKALRILCELAPPKKESLDFLRTTQRLAPVFSYIKENLKGTIAVSDLAEIAHISLSRFHTFFQQQMKITPMDYVKALRLTEASHKLIATEWPLAQIADTVGFRNQFHFSREFKSRFGLNPSKYRETHKYFKNP